MKLKDFIKFLEQFPENTEIKVPQALYFYDEADVTWVDFDPTRNFIFKPIHDSNTLYLGDI